MSVNRKFVLQNHKNKFGAFSAVADFADKKISELKFSKAKRLFIDVFITHADSIITHFSYWHG
jgi:hypothetical protein